MRLDPRMAFKGSTNIEGNIDCNFWYTQSSISQSNPSASHQTMAIPSPSRFFTSLASSSSHSRSSLRSQTLLKPPNACFFTSRSTVGARQVLARITPKRVRIEVPEGYHQKSIWKPIAVRLATTSCFALLKRQLLTTCSQRITCFPFF